MAADLPVWVYDMVMAMQQRADEHPVLFVQLPDDTYVRADSCGCASLGLVPAEVLAEAKAIASYLRGAGR
jgi:hypothetical protein